jgi:hypothetical protein
MTRWPEQHVIAVEVHDGPSKGAGLHALSEEA